MRGQLKQITYNPIHALQALVPRTGLDHTEALVVAEVQATVLLKMVGVMRPPVPVLILAEYLDVDCRYDPEAGELGYHIRLDDCWCIGYGDTRSFERDAAVAHQLKLILDTPFDDDELYPPVWVMAPILRKHHVAEYFAQCLTLPGAWVEHLWCSGQHDVEALAEVFGVTPGCMGFRLKTLRLVEPSWKP